MKECKKCKYCLRDIILKHNKITDFCRSPEARETFFNITGEWPTCKALRNDDHYCGKEAKWLKEK